MTDWDKSSADMANALHESTNGANSGDGKGPVRDQEKIKQSREAGWSAPQAYNYDAASAKPGEPATTPGGEHTEDNGVLLWAHQAVKYEWQEDFGDVGPEVPELEAQLFKSDTRTRIGQHLEK